MDADRERDVGEYDEKEENAGSGRVLKSSRFVQYQHEDGPRHVDGGDDLGAGDEVGAAAAAGHTDEAHGRAQAQDKTKRTWLIRVQLCQIVIHRKQGNSKINSGK